MKYHGKLYGKLWNKYFDTGKTSDDYDKLEDRIKELEAQLKNLNGNTEKRVETICPKCESKQKMKIWQNPVKYMCGDCGHTWDE